MKKYLVLISLGLSLFGFGAGANTSNDLFTSAPSQKDPTAIVNTQGDVGILYYRCEFDGPGQPTPQPKSTISPLLYGGGPGTCYTDGEPCPSGYDSQVRYCWNGGWYRCGYVCHDIYTPGSHDDNIGDST